MGRVMGRSVLASVAAICLVACNGVIAADDRGLGLGDWNLGYVDAGSYYGSSGGSSSSPSLDSSVPPPPDDGGTFSFEAGDAFAPPPPPPAAVVCPSGGDSAYSWSLTPSASECHFEVPTGGPDPLRIDPTAMYLDISSPVAPELYADYRPTLADCDALGGWTWGLDDATAGPTRIALCPDTCKLFADSALAIHFTTTTQCVRP